MKKYSVRLATAADAGGMLKIYGHYVLHSSATFEYEIPSEEEFARRINAVIPDFPWLVCLCGGAIVGYAYAHKHRERAAYQWSPESTIYIAAAHHGTGIAQIMYRTLFTMLKMQGFYNVYASVLSTNTSSNKFHLAAGFEWIGLFKNIGYKLGEWHSNNWYQLHLSSHILNPPPPKTMLEMWNDTAFEELLMTANEELSTLSVMQ